MQNYNVSIEELTDTSQPNPAPVYAVLLGQGEVGRKNRKLYSDKETFIADLTRYFGYTDSAIAKFFSQPLVNGVRHKDFNHSLNDDDAAALGWW
jgi:hypothetical protein